MTNEDLQQIQNLVNSAHRVLVITHANPSIDTMASALATYLALVKMGKDVTVAMETLPLVEVSNLVGIDKVRTELGGKNLLITYKPYTLGDFEKVSYLEDPGISSSPTDDSFKLTITPRDGFSPDPKNFNFSYIGASNFDLVVCVDVLEPTQVGRLYDPQLFATAPIINIDNHDPNKDFGKFNLVEPDAASISEIVTFFLRAINAQIDVDIASNLYQGIIQATGNFQSEKVAAATFEASAICLRAGARISGPASRSSYPSGQNMGQNVSPTMVSPSQSRPVAQPVISTRQNTPQGTNAPNAAQPTSQSVPEDWTQPKAYRGTSVI